ncbi:hypothetical protein CO046_05035 [Candidatus Peregrinibacteria bacterium CG_4_9_14_0_2_um_filter_53_11]|nr:MAG: hypothetical protein CO046_05035 [Candidatus Peregrinibacteria bacterium CG_4_9_14_0_2_um_filter_53_11]
MRKSAIWSKCGAGIMLVLGILFMLGTAGVWPEFTFMKYWPLFLILFGLHGLFCSCCKGGMMMKEGMMKKDGMGGDECCKK